MAHRPIFKAQNAVFPAFPHPFSFEIGPKAKTAVLGHLRGDLLNVVAGRVADPAKRISFPGIGHEFWPSQAIQLTRFGQKDSTNARAPFVGARYESFRDEFDVSLLTFLKEKAAQGTTEKDIDAVAKTLDLTDLLDRWIVGLSNGQSRRAQLAVALLRRPKMLVMDEPFLGLDPRTREKFSNILNRLPIPVVLGLREGDALPDWLTQVIYASKEKVCVGAEAIGCIRQHEEQLKALRENRERKAMNRKFSADSVTKEDKPRPLIELRNVSLTYRGADKPLFDKLNLTVYPGERIHIKGPNGSGKSTLLALITADHPQVWSKDITLFGEKLKVGKQSYFTINKHIGVSSPELHAIFPKYLTARKAISTAFSGNMLPPTNLSPEQSAKIDAVMDRLGIDRSDSRFGQLSLAQQKLVLLARALVKSPKILVLDEAFSTLAREQLDTAFQAIEDFKGAVLVVGHVAEEIPLCDKTVELQG